jgi:hypothetical protein
MSFAHSVLHPADAPVSINDLELWKEIMADSSDSAWDQTYSSDESSDDSEFIRPADYEQEMAWLEKTHVEDLATPTQNAYVSTKLVPSNRSPCLWSHRDEYGAYMSNQYWKESLTLGHDGKSLI